MATAREQKKKDNGMAKFQAVINVAQVIVLHCFPLETIKMLQTTTRNYQNVANILSSCILEEPPQKRYLSPEIRKINFYKPVSTH